MFEAETSTSCAPFITADVTAPTLSSMVKKAHLHTAHAIHMRAARACTCMGGMFEVAIHIRVHGVDEQPLISMQSAN